jgi:cytochrome c556
MIRKSGHRFSEKIMLKQRGRGPRKRGPRHRLKTLQKGERPMKRTAIAMGALLLGAGAAMAQQEIAVKQDNLMRAQAKSLYTVMLKMTKGEVPYDQAAVNAAIAQLAESVPTIPSVFATNPKQDVVDATYGSSQKIWQNKADFDSRVPPVAKAIADVKGKIKDVASLKVAYDSINGKCNECHETYRVKLK